ncbi:hypothetical protein SAMN06295910_0734 [Allosphingosinicella indica]|uniref:GIY-YIG domain-containing protein n=1 Tax=Allosphingosinicella indica TaxID=941907 RepID=A0A1X7G073_9SPHN|nr:hypothetical protein SAMN06295910_0734 [Allosphingosinicella indica]
MPLTFNGLLAEHGLSPKGVRLLRHAKRQGAAGMSPLQAWRDDRPRFEAYQSTQPAKDRAFFDAPYWASFVAFPPRETMFVGLYRIAKGEERVPAFDCPLTARQVPEGQIDRWATQPHPDFMEFAGKLFIDWGAGTRSWGQRAERRNKPILELRRDDHEETYPGHTAFLRQLSEVEALPPSWVAILRSSRGVYLLTCPATREQYVGAAFAQGGFHERWVQHAGRQGDAIAFRSRAPSDYRVSILEVAGSLATDQDIIVMEQRWKAKLQSREMGLNRN